MDFYRESFNKIRILKPNIKDSSINSYLLNIKKISKECFNSDKPSINYFNVFDIVHDYIEANIKNLSSKKNMMTSILVLVKAYYDINGSSKTKELIDKYTEYHKDLSVSQDNSYLDNIKTTKEDSNWTSRDEIINKIADLKIYLQNKKKTRIYVDKFQQYLVLNLYTLIPPLRNDYVLVKVMKEINCIDELDKTCNYINLNTNELLLCQYKTSKFYGIKTIPLPLELIAIILDWEKIKTEFYDSKLKHGYLLLNTTNAQNMKHNTLTKYINKIFYPKKISSTLLRKIYLSEKYPVLNTYREMQQDSYIMGHNIDMARKVYSKKLN